MLRRICRIVSVLPATIGLASDWGGVGEVVQRPRVAIVSASTLGPVLPSQLPTTVPLRLIPSFAALLHELRTGDVASILLYEPQTSEVVPVVGPSMPAPATSTKFAAPGQPSRTTQPAPISFGTSTNSSETSNDLSTGVDAETPAEPDQTPTHPNQPPSALPPAPLSAWPTPQLHLSGQMLLDMLGDGLVLIDCRGRVLWHNPAFQDLCNHSAINPLTPLQQVLDCADLSQLLQNELQNAPQDSLASGLTPTTPARQQITLASGSHFELLWQSLDTVDLLVEPMSPVPPTSTVATADTVVEIPGDPVTVPLGTDPTTTACLPWWLLRFHDVTTEVREREKLIAIHRAGLELSNLSYEELAHMSTSERVDLLKANIIHYSGKILNFRNLEVRLYDPQTNELRVLLSEGITEPNAHRILRAGVSGFGHTGYVAATGRSYLCREVLQDPLYIPGAPNARSSLTVPIIHRESVIGTFNVESPIPNHFSATDQEFLEIFAREIGVALKTLELLQAEQQLGGSATMQTIIHEVSLPVDEMIADLLHLTERVADVPEQAAFFRDSLTRILNNAREIKRTIREVNIKVQPDPEKLLPSANVRNFAGRRILFVDNDPPTRRSAHQLLGKIGCVVDTAREGHEAVVIARTMEYDVIIGDIRLPDMNGYEFFRAMREANEQAALVLMSGFGYDAAHSIVRSRQEGLRAILYKPFRLDRLCEAIEEALEGNDASARHHHPVDSLKQQVL